jgi:soluble lytic murein transglycosylase-like protein
MMLSRAWVFDLPWDVITDVASRENVPVNLLAAIVFVESGGNKHAARFEKDYKYVFQTKKFALEANTTETTEMMLQMTSWGLCQIMGAVARENGISGPMMKIIDPEVNLTIACRLIKKLASKHSQRDDIIASYNSGSPIKTIDGKYRNQAYVDKVNAAISIIQSMQKV